jgi:hypothetical protein
MERQNPPCHVGEFEYLWNFLQQYFPEPLPGPESVSGDVELIEEPIPSPLRSSDEEQYRQRPANSPDQVKRQQREGSSAVKAYEPRNKKHSACGAGPAGRIARVFAMRISAKTITQSAFPRPRGNPRISLGEREDLDYNRHERRASE